MHSRAYTCIHAHFGDFSCVQLRSFLLISLQLRLQLLGLAAVGAVTDADTVRDEPSLARGADAVQAEPHAPGCTKSLTTATPQLDVESVGNCGEDPM
jgi:hypothetical protein